MSEGVLCLLWLCEKGCAEIAPSSGFSAAKLRICQLTLISNICILSCIFFQCLDTSRFSYNTFLKPRICKLPKRLGCRTFQFHFQRKDPWKLPLASSVFFSPSSRLWTSVVAMAPWLCCAWLMDWAKRRWSSIPRNHPAINAFATWMVKLGKHLWQVKNERCNFELEVFGSFACGEAGSKRGYSPCPGDAWSPFVDGEISYDQRPLQQVQQRPFLERVLCQQGLPVFHITFLDCRSCGYYPASTVVDLLEDQGSSSLLRRTKRAVLNCGGGLARTP